jgi:DNA-binding transcriptional regulator LsrR (DeoR family)
VRGRVSGNEIDDAARAAWLYHLGGYTQGQIAKRLGVSRVKVNRLIAAAHEEGLVTITIRHRLSRCLELEHAIVQRHGLEGCIVAPRLGQPGMSDIRQITAALGHEGAHFLANHLRSQSLSVVGVGWGRTLAAVAEHLGKIARPDIKIVSLLGSLTRYSATNPFDVVHRLAAQTGAMGYILPVPFLADSAKDKAILEQQKTVQDVIRLAERADLYVIGLGALRHYDRFDQQGLLQKEDLVRLRETGTAGDILGTFIDREGNPVRSEVNERSMGFPLTGLSGKTVVAVAGGPDKLDVIEAALKSGLITTLVTDEDVAERLAGQA